MSTFKNINLHWGSMMDFWITKLKLFLISTKLGYNVKKQNKTKQKHFTTPFTCTFFFP